VKYAAVALAGLCLLAGCAQFKAKPLSPEQTAAQFEARSLDDPGLKQFVEQNLKRDFTNWPLREWDFDALTLAALYYHPSLDVARAQWAVAQAGIRTAGQHPNPAANLAPQYTTNSPSGESPWIAALTFEPIFETAGKRGHRIEQAKQLSESARLKLAAQAWQVRSRLRTALLDYASARQRVVLLQNVRDAQQQILKLLEGRLKAGEVAATELTTPRVALIRTLADLADAQRQTADSQAAVAQALGVPLQALAGRELKFQIRNPKSETNSKSKAPNARAEPGSVSNLGFEELELVSSFEIRASDLRRQALHGRADLLAALADYAASQSALQLEIAKQYPDIRLGPGYEYDQGLHKWGLAVGTDFLPVLNRNQGPIAEAQAKREQAAAEFLALQVQVIGEIDRALAARTASQDQLRQIDALLDTQRKHVQAVEAMVKAGAADQFDLRSAELEVATTEQARLDALVKVQQALGQLEDAVQVPVNALPSVEQNPRAAEAAEIRNSKHDNLVAPPRAIRNKFQ
jgi:cobalt-zinc-cadmium efflux system outer membrane protein